MLPPRDQCKFSIIWFIPKMSSPNADWFLHVLGRVLTNWMFMARAWEAVNSWFHLDKFRVKFCTEKQLHGVLAWSDYTDYWWNDNPANGSIWSWSWLLATDDRSWKWMIDSFWSWNMQTLYLIKLLIVIYLADRANSMVPKFKCHWLW